MRSSSRSLTIKVYASRAFGVPKFRWKVAGFGTEGFGGFGFIPCGLPCLGYVSGSKKFNVQELVLINGST